MIDGIGLDDRGVVLELVDEADWHDERDHLEALAAKLATYAHAIETGQACDALVAAAGCLIPSGTPVRVHILARCEPTPAGKQLIDDARRRFACMGVAVSFEVQLPEPT